jgi:hypothetical protein
MNKKTDATKTVSEVQTYLCPGLPGRYVQIEDYQALQAQLAKAREDALREAADFIKAKQAQQKMACVVWPEEILALIDTPTPAPSPDDLVKAAEMMVKAYREESDRVITAFYALEEALAAMKGGDT